MRSIGDFERALRVAAVSLAIAAAFFVLIMGIFGSVFDTSIAMLVGMGIVLGGLWLLLLTIVARLARRSYAPAGRAGRKAFFVTVLVVCVGGATLVFGTWQGARFFMQRPIYQEAAIESPTPNAF